MHRDMFKIQDGVAIVEKLNWSNHMELDALVISMPNKTKTHTSLNIFWNIFIIIDSIWYNAAGQSY